MNKDDLNTLKRKITEVMLTYLKTKGYPNISGQQIVQECPNMWRAIAGAGLMRPEMSYQAFVQAAHHEYVREAFERQFASHFKKS